MSPLLTDTRTPGQHRADLRIALSFCPIVAVNDDGRVIGGDHHRAKLTDHDVDLIIDLRAHGLRYAEIAEKFEVSLSTVASICQGRRRSQTIMGQQNNAMRT